MSETPSSEPTMEEILASIRRIISEDEQPAEEAKLPELEPEPESAAPELPPIPPEPEPEPAPVASIPIPDDEPEDDALELTQRVETHGDLDVLAPSEPALPEDVGEPPPPVAGHEPFWPPGTAKIVSEPTEEAAALAFGRLSSQILMPAHGRTLEDVVRELLAPLLKGWLDDNLPRIVQTAVEEEVQRIARGGRPPGV